jgi:hypothetical protein
MSRDDEKNSAPETVDRSARHRKERAGKKDQTGGGIEANNHQPPNPSTTLYLLNQLDQFLYPSRFHGTTKSRNQDVSSQIVDTGHAFIFWLFLARPRLQFHSCAVSLEGLTDRRYRPLVSLSAAVGQYAGVSHYYFSDVCLINSGDVVEV